MRKKVETELERLTKQGKIEPVTFADDKITVNLLSKVLGGCFYFINMSRHKGALITLVMGYTKSGNK